jgi:uncharacterized membrane protein
METKPAKNGLFLLLGIAFWVQALGPVIGDAVMFKPFVTEDNIQATMSNIANNATTVKDSTLLIIITSVFIIILGVAMYMAAGHMNKTMAMIALGMYVFEAFLLAVSQVLIFGLVENSKHYLASGDPGLPCLGNILLSGSSFVNKIAMLPFGIGAVLFYYLLLKAKTIPKWLALWGLITVSFFVIGAPLSALGITRFFIPYLLYAPFEFVTGTYILLRHRKMPLNYA